jgi:hypothetical protein
VPTYVVFLIGVASLTFAGAGAFAIVRPEPIARFVESRGITLRIGAPVAPTADNVRLIGIVWVAAGTLLAVIAFIFAATH